MAITVRGLVSQERLPVTLRAGESGLDGEVLWVHASDLPAPWQYLARNEALLTNGTGMTSDPATQRRFVARLKQAGASALGYGLETGPALTDAAIEEADRVGLPLFTLSKYARFSALAQIVAEANASQERREMHSVARIYEILQNALAMHASIADVLGELSAEIDARICLVDARDGSPISDSPATAFAVEVAAIEPASADSAPDLIRLPASATSAGRSAVVLPLAPESAVALVIEAPDDELPSRTLLLHLRTAAGVELTQLRSATNEPTRSPLLTQLLAGRLDPTTAAVRLRAHGMEPARCVLIAARKSTASGLGAPAYLPIGGWSGVRHIAATRGGRYHVLIDPGADADSGPDGLAVSGWVVGASAALVSLDRVGAALDEAEWSANLALVQKQEVVTSGDPAQWALPGSRPAAEDVVRRTVGSLTEHDAARGTAYVSTLRTWLDEDRSWQRAAAALGIHKQTLGYRLRKIEDLLGHGLTSTGDLAAMWAGVRVIELLELDDTWRDSRD